MRFRFKAALISLGLAICFNAPAGQAPSSDEQLLKENDWQLLALAMHVNFLREVEGRCESVMPGYSARFRAAYAKAKSTLYDRLGITEALLKKAETIPDLQVAEPIAKFARKELGQKKKDCEANLDDLDFAAEMGIQEALQNTPDASGDERR